MQRHTRREFLAHSVALGASALIGPQLLRAAMADARASDVDMTIVRWAGEGNGAAGGKSLAARLTEKAIAEIGGMKRFVKKGANVWVKPNIGWNKKVEHAADTHPDVVAELIRLCLDAGAKKVKVGDYPCNDAKQSYENSGIAPAAKEAGAEVVYLDRSRFRDMKIGGNRLKTHPVYPEMVECDLLISVPICKHHGSTRVSLAMKNYMGCVEKRNVFHQDLPTTIADVTQFMKPVISVLDATRMLTDHGPVGGDLADVKTMNCVAAGTDIVALDAFGAELLGNEPRTIDTITKGQEYKLGTMDYRSLRLKELSLS
ncbi:MAG: DUF362 domain-containing protein [Phycisphaerae bacterium]|nr:DUF362 domain-containing protein [Phycisphaerae bacterium]